MPEEFEFEVFQDEGKITLLLSPPGQAPLRVEMRHGNANTLSRKLTSDMGFIPVFGGKVRVVPAQWVVEFLPHQGASPVRITVLEGSRQELAEALLAPPRISGS